MVVGSQRNPAGSPRQTRSAPRGGLDRRAILPPMSRPVLLALAVGTVCSASCDVRGAAGAALASLGTPSFREVAPREAHRLVERGGARLVQARGEEPPAHHLSGAQLVAPGEGLADGEAERRIVVVSEEPALGLQLGAQLARKGATGVAVMMGGLPEWERPDREE